MNTTGNIETISSQASQKCVEGSETRMYDLSNSVEGYEIPRAPYSDGPYVYIYLDPMKPGRYDYSEISFNYEPFYVGVGTRNRCLFHIYKAAKSDNKTLKLNKIRKIYKASYTPIIEKLDDFSTREEALLKESSLIKSIGRRMYGDGPLVNIDEGNSPLDNLDIDQIRKRSKSLSEAMIGNTRWENRDNSYQKSEKNKALLLFHAKQGYSRGKGIPKSELHRENMSKAMTGVKHSIKHKICTFCEERVKYIYACVISHFKRHSIVSFDNCVNYLTDDIVRSA